MRKFLYCAAIFFMGAMTASAQQGGAAQGGGAGRAANPQLRQFIRTDAPVIALTNVRIIDGTGAAARDGQTIIVDHGKIVWVGAASAAQIPQGAQVLDLTGYSVMPGMVGMHEHLFYPAGGQYNELSITAPRLYLACGVTTARTAGSLEPYADLNLKQMIDEGRAIGPKLNVTGPYLEGPPGTGIQMHMLSGPQEATEMVNYWAELGAGSFKAYMHITHAELAAAIAAAHAKGIKITGHLCSIGFREAAALGIDNLEHGFVVDTEFVPGKQPDVCTPQPTTFATNAKLDIEGEEVQQTIRELVAHHVAITSTLPVFETFVSNRPPMAWMQRPLTALLPQEAVEYLSGRARNAAQTETPWNTLFKSELQFEHDFVKAGGALLAGVDPTGGGGDLPGFGDQREVELLVEAGFTPLEAIHIATANGAEFLGLSGSVGTIAQGKAADLLVIHGDPSTTIADIEKVEIVFKDGVGYDSQKLIDSVRGMVGLH
ncbi:MAG TPA: amidohydrolase family protein [Candidatus Acidoferrales bacterium]|nr:amidohydrolase family protein [Candidatus Acidoferrales bacterium]